MTFKNKFAGLYLLLIAFVLQPALVEAQKVKERSAKSIKPKAVTKSLLWEVSGNGLKNPSYLYGTYHLLNDSYLNDVPEVKQRFEGSKGVVVETELDSAVMMQMGAKMIMPDKKISGLLSAEDYTLVSKEVKQTIGYDMAMLDQMKPMTLMVMLSVLEYQKLDVLKPYKGKPLDAYFAQQGRSDGKKITSLETVEEQLDLLYNHYPVEKQAKQLVEYVKQKEAALKVQEQLTNLYFEKDLAGMWAASETYNKLTGEEDISYMVDDRNKKWMTKLPTIMKDQPTFVAVGALHLPGENGLIKLLQKAGYTVKPLQ